MQYTKGSDGLLYEDLGALLLGEAAIHPFNTVVESARKADCEKEAIAVYSHHYLDALENEGTWDHQERHAYAQGAVQRAGYKRLYSSPAYPRPKITFDPDAIAKFADHIKPYQDALVEHILHGISDAYVRSRSGDGLTCVGETAAAAVRAADQPAVHSGLGPQGHLPAP